MELWAAVGQVRGERERDLRNGGSGKGDGGGVGGAEGWAVVDEESMERLAKVRLLPSLLFSFQQNRLRLMPNDSSSFSH
jgi:hypothetical protein